jgi:hypothetical protein
VGRDVGLRRDDHPVLVILALNVALHGGGSKPQPAEENGSAQKRFKTKRR